jgi:Zn-finger protein
MNEIDLKTKIEGLKKAIAEHKDFTGTYESQLKETEQELKDYNKVELTPTQLDDIYEAVDTAICNYDFSDSDNYNIEYGIDYDGRVNCENIELSHNNDLIEAIVEKVSRLFKEADAPEDELDTTEKDNHKPE